MIQFTCKMEGFFWGEVVGRDLLQEGRPIQEGMHKV
jgi:hypothetical protein